MRQLWRVMLAALLSGLVFLAAYDRFSDVVTTKGWNFRPLHSGIEKVSALSIVEGSLFVTQELPVERGTLLRIEAGKAIPVLEGLTNPDGLLARGDYFYISQERKDGKLFRMNRITGEVRAIARLDNAEAVAADEDGAILVVEDMPAGRLVRVSRDGNVETVLRDLAQPEGVCRDRDGVVYISIKVDGTILRLKDDELTVLLDDLIKPGYVFCHTDGSLWITEDRTHSGRLFRFHKGKLHLIASRLRSPQAVISDGEEGMFVAEQRRDRVLHFIPSGSLH